MAEEELYTQGELAAILKRSVTTVSSWVRREWLVPVAHRWVRGRSQWTFSLAAARSLDATQARQGAPAVEKPLGKPKKPTYTAPGSPERLKVYRRRAARREEIFHENDERIEAPTWMAREFVGSHKAGQRNGR